MDNDKKQIINAMIPTIIGSAASFIIAELLKGFDNMLVEGLIIIGALVFIIGIWLLINYLINKRKNKYSLSNNSLIRKCKNECKIITKRADKNAKLMKKFSHELAIREEREKELLKQMSNFSYKKEDKIEKVRKISDELCNTMIKLDRVLLFSEQYKARIDFGEYIIKYSKNDSYIQKAYIEFLGWTYFLLGKEADAIYYIDKGIKRIEKYIEEKLPNANECQNETIETKIRLMRAYRHLGSAPVIYKKDPNRAIDYIKVAYETYKEIDKEKINDPSCKKKIFEMSYGIKYGIYVARLYEYFNGQQTKHDYLKLKLYYEDLEKTMSMLDGVSQTHRKMKLSLLQNKYSETIKKDQSKLSNEITTPVNNQSWDLFDDINNLIPWLGDIEKLSTLEKEKESKLKGIESATKIIESAIYVDDATEMYFEQIVDILGNNITNIIEEKEVR